MLDQTGFRDHNIVAGFTQLHKGFLQVPHANGVAL